MLLIVYLLVIVDNYGYSKETKMTTQNIQQNSDWAWADNILNCYLTLVEEGKHPGKTLSPDSAVFNPKTGNHIYYDDENGLMATVLIDAVMVSSQQ